MKSLAAALCLLGFSLSTTASEWRIASATANPGSSAPLAVSLTGDGQTSAAQIDIVFDESRLKLPVASGLLVGAGQNGGQCSRISSNRVRVITSFGQNPLPSATTSLCTLPFTLFANAPRGQALVRGIGQECSSSTGSQTCTVVNGAVLVPGTLQPPAANPAPTFKYLNVLLSAAPGAPTVADFERVDFSAPGPRPLAALNVGNPRGVYGLLYKRAQGDFAEFLRLNPNTARAKMERFVLVQYPATTQLAPALTALRPHLLLCARSNL